MFWQLKKSCKGDYLVYILFVYYDFWKDNTNIYFILLSVHNVLMELNQRAREGNRKGRLQQPQHRQKSGNYNCYLSFY